MSVEVQLPGLSAFQSAAAVPKLIRGAITYVAGTTGAIGATTLFTVTGDVLIHSLMAKCTTDLTSGGTPTFDLGIVGSTQLFGATFPDVTGWDAGEWAETNTPTYLVGSGYANLAGAANATYLPVPVAANIIQTIAGATITGGVVNWYLQYVPLSAGASVALHANLAAI